jgi:hypothetical protein
MVLMRQRRAKQGHDAVAEHLVHRAFKAMYGVHHNVDSWVEKLLGRFRIEALDEPGRVLDVGKEHGDLLAFACQGSAGGEDLLGQVGRRVGQRRLVGGRWGSSGGSFRSAGPDQDSTPLIDRQPLGLDEFLLQGRKLRLVQGELHLKRRVGDTPTTLQKLADLIEYGIKVHSRRSG